MVGLSLDGVTDVEAQNFHKSQSRPPLYRLVAINVSRSCLHWYSLELTTSPMYKDISGTLRSRITYPQWFGVHDSTFSAFARSMSTLPSLTSCIDISCLYAYLLSICTLPKLNHQNHQAKSWGIRKTRRRPPPLSTFFSSPMPLL